MSLIINCNYYRRLSFVTRRWCCVSDCTLQKTVQQPTQLLQPFGRLSVSCLNAL